jgi:hypothetical protein
MLVFSGDLGRFLGSGHPPGSLSASTASEIFCLSAAVNGTPGGSVFRIRRHLGGQGLGQCVELGAAALADRLGVFGEVDHDRAGQSYGPGRPLAWLLVEAVEVRACGYVTGRLVLR